MDSEAYSRGGPEKEPRAPRRTDLSRICAELNRLGAQYIVVGGFAIIEAGLPRLTGDIDLLVDTSPENEERIFNALRILPDRAVDELEPGDIERFTVVRVADEIVIDLMKNSCGVEYSQAINDAIIREIEGVKIPFASPQSLWLMKQTVREKDIVDRAFLRELLEAEGLSVSSMSGKSPKSLWDSIRAFFGKTN